MCGYFFFFAAFFAGFFAFFFVAMMWSPPPWVFHRVRGVSVRLLHLALSALRLQRLSPADGECGD
jgi:hypothetical protein